MDAKIDGWRICYVDKQKKPPGAELQVIPNAAHVSNLENTEAFNKYLWEFLNRVEGI